VGSTSSSRTAGWTLSELNTAHTALAFTRLRQTLPATLRALGGVSWAHSQYLGWTLKGHGALSHQRVFFSSSDAARIIQDLVEAGGFPLSPESTPPPLLRTPSGQDNTQSLGVVARLYIEVSLAGPRVEGPPPLHFERSQFSDFFYWPQCLLTLPR